MAVASRRVLLHASQGEAARLRLRQTSARAPHEPHPRDASRAFGSECVRLLCRPCSASGHACRDGGFDDVFFLVFFLCPFV